MLLLCSNGLTSSALLTSIALCTNAGKAALVVTADNVYKERNYHVPRCRQELESLGFFVDLFDLDLQPAQELLQYDAVEFIGGNPFYLLQSLREHAVRDVLQKISDDRLLIGWSAGALVLGPSIGIVESLSPELNSWKLSDLSGLGLTEIQILPHYGKFLTRCDRLEERLREYETRNRCSLLRLYDGEGVRIDGSDLAIIGR